jgi:protein-disulfide isomerase
MNSSKVASEIEQSPEQLGEESDGQSGEPSSDSSKEELTFGDSLQKAQFPEKFKLKEIVIGKESAAKEVIIYFSYTCPHCCEFHREEFPKFKKKFVDTGKVKVIFRNYIDDQGALEAAEIIRCLYNETAEDYMRLSEVVLRHQEEWMKSAAPQEFLKDIFVQSGFDKEKVGACLLRSDIGAGLMIEQKKAMHELQIMKMPAFIVDGKVHIGTLDCKSLAEMCGFSCN